MNHWGAHAQHDVAGAGLFGGRAGGWSLVRSQSVAAGNRICRLVAQLLVVGAVCSAVWFLPSVSQCLPWHLHYLLAGVCRWGNSK
jgi:hypothetical protein